MRETQNKNISFAGAPEDNAPILWSCRAAAGRVANAVETPWQRAPSM